MARVRVECDIETTDDKKVRLIPKTKLDYNQSYFITTTTDVKSASGVNLSEKFESSFVTVKKENKDILWFGCDNDGTKPIIRDKEDYNPYGFELSSDVNLNTLSDSEHRIVGNGCLIVPSNSASPKILLTPNKQFTLEQGIIISFYFYIQTFGYNVFQLIKIYNQSDDDRFNSLLRIDLGNQGDMGLDISSYLGGHAHYDFNSTVLPNATWNHFEFVIPKTGNPSFLLNHNLMTPAYTAHINLGSELVKKIGFSSNMSPCATIYGADNLYITTDLEKDLYKYRGFDAYPPNGELPAPPPEPDYDIKFWLTGMSDGLTPPIPIVRHYGDSSLDKDYCSGSWLNPDVIPSILVNSTIKQIGNSSLYLYNMGGGGETFKNVFNMPLSLPANQSFRIGAWIRGDVDGGGISGARLVLSESSARYIMILPYVVNPSFMIDFYLYHDINNEYRRLQLYKNFPSKTFYFVEFSIDRNNKKITGYVNGENVPDKSVGYTNQIDFKNIILCSNGGGTTKDYFQNIMISSNPELDMYNTMVGGKRLCELTEYPRKKITIDNVIDCSVMGNTAFLPEESCQTTNDNKELIVDEIRANSNFVDMSFNPQYGYDKPEKINELAKRSLDGTYLTTQLSSLRTWKVPLTNVDYQTAFIFNKWREDKTVFAFTPDTKNAPDESISVFITNETNPFSAQISPILDKAYEGELELQEYKEFVPEPPTPPIPPDKPKKYPIWWRFANDEEEVPSIIMVNGYGKDNNWGDAPTYMGSDAKKVCSKEKIVSKINGSLVLKVDATNTYEAVYLSNTDKLIREPLNEFRMGFWMRVNKGFHYAKNSGSVNMMLYMGGSSVNFIGYKFKFCFESDFPTLDITKANKKGENKVVSYKIDFLSKQDQWVWHWLYINSYKASSMLFVDDVTCLPTKNEWIPHTFTNAFNEFELRALHNIAGVPENKCYLSNLIVSTDMLIDINEYKMARGFLRV